MHAGKPASFINNQSLVILSFPFGPFLEGGCNGEAIDLGGTGSALSGLQP